MSSPRMQTLPEARGPGILPDSAYLLLGFEVLLRERISPSFLRITFVAQEDIGFTSWGPDQRVKLYLPQRGAFAPRLPHTGWNAAWQELDPAMRPSRRSYTIRNIRVASGELDIDFVDHGVDGPASAWASRAQPGDVIQIAVPNANFSGKPIGYEWRPPNSVSRLLILGDETALPAISNIIDCLPKSVSSVDCFIEVPKAGDDAAAGDIASRITWLNRDGDVPGAKLRRALSYSQIPELAALKHKHGFEKTIAEGERMWDPAANTSGPFYAWIAAEGSTVKYVRHALLKQCDLPKTAVSSMGYWYLGRPFH